MNTKLLLFLTLILSVITNLKAKNNNDGLYFDENSEWSYLDDGSIPDNDWTKYSYNDSHWKKGNGFFGFGYGNENTLLIKGQPSYYLRKKITIDNIKELPNVIYLYLMQDQNVVLHINDVKIFRNEIFSKTETSDDSKQNTKNTLQLNWYQYNILTSYFVEGDNIITIEILNNNQESSRLVFNGVFFDPPMHKDGPYVFYRENDVEVVTITDDGIKREYHSLTDDIQLTVQDPTSDSSFSFPLKKEHTIPQAIHSAPLKLLITSDIEGQFGAYKKMLIDAKVMNEKFEWIYGDGHLVLSGDMVDRGEYVTEVLWLTYKLQHEAEKAGGKVQFVLGNHEILVMNNNVRYVHNKYKENITHLKIAYSDLFSNDSEFGRWMRKKNIIEKVGDYTIVHGGVSPEVANLGLSYEEMNNHGRSRFNMESCRGECRIIGDEKLGLYWYRGMGQQTISQEEVDHIVSKINTGKIIIGHTLYPEITSIYEDKVIVVDVRHRRNYVNGKVEALVFEDNCFKRFVSDNDGIQKTSLIDDCSKLSTTNLQKQEIKIYPNPTKDWIYIEGSSSNQIIELYDIAGKLIHTNQHKKLTTININIGNLPKGIYLLRIIDKNTKEIYQKKIIKN
ncbi:T9SS type A sorting domain-containing protein [Chishuiella changwenlii]|uniref:T9SS type A sorting domain-containing protein n=1 Tax=Chishuiella changwenlii TaxID=1434701 RepID=UPI002FDAEE68